MPYLFVCTGIAQAQALRLHGNSAAENGTGDSWGWGTTGKQIDSMQGIGQTIKWRLEAWKLVIASIPVVPGTRCSIGFIQLKK